MTEARQVCRNTITTSTTSAMASSSVCTTASMLARTNCVGSYSMRYCTEGGKSLDSSAMVSRTWLDTCSAFEPGACMMPMATACLLFSSERSA